MILQRLKITVALEVASHSNSTALTSAAYAPSLKLLPRVRRHSSGHRSNLVPRILRHSSIRVCRVCAVTPVATNSVLPRISTAPRSRCCRVSLHFHRAWYRPVCLPGECTCSPLMTQRWLVCWWRVCFYFVVCYSVIVWIVMIPKLLVRIKPASKPH